MPTRCYSAFISYRHADNTQEGRRWAEWLHRGLERYVVPPDLIGTPNLRAESIRDSLYPIFRDEDELPANADLATGIRAALEVSDYLIVLCSPRSAVSPWVRKEVREFKELGRSDRILAIIIAGEPNADDPAKAREGIMRDEECFCEELRFGSMREDGTIDWTFRTEPLAADLRPVGTRAEGFVTAEAYREYLNVNSSFTPEKIAALTEAYRQRLDQSLLKVIAGLLGVPLGQLIDRDAAHRADLAKKELKRSQAEAARLRTFSHRLVIAGAAALVLALLAGVFWWRARVERTAAVAAQDHAEKAEAEAVKAQAEERTQRQKSEATTTKLRESDAKQESMLLTASYGDHEAALLAEREGRHDEALAYFERALRYSPKNMGALAASAAHAFGSDAPAWHTRSVFAFEGGVTCLAFSPDGRYFAAGIEMSQKSGNELRVIELVTGKEVRKTKFVYKVKLLNFSPDGRFLARASEYGTVYVTEMATDKQVSMTKLGYEVTSLSFSPNGLFLAVGGEDKTARLIEVTTGKEVSKTEFGGKVTSVSFSPAGRFLAVGSDDNTLCVIEADTGKQVSKTQLFGGVMSVSFSPDGCFLAVGGGREDKTARVFQVATGKVVSKAEFENSVTSVSFSPDGRFLALGSGDFDSRKGEARVIEATTGKVFSKTEFGDMVTSVSFSPDGRFLVAGGKDKTVRVIEASAGKQVSKAEFDRYVGGVTSMSFSPDGGLLAAGACDRTARVIEVATGKLVSKTEFVGGVTSVSFSPDGRFVAVGCGIFNGRKGEACVIEATTGKKISKTDFPDRVTSVSFSPNGHFVAAGSGDFHSRKGEARVIEATTGKEVSKTEFGSMVTSVSFSPDGCFLATGSDDKTVRVIEVATGKEVSKTEFWKVAPVSFSHHGRFLAVGSYNTAHVIEAATGKEVSKTEFGGTVTSVSFSPNDRYLAVGSYDETVHVIEATTSKQASKTKFGSWVTSVSFNPDGLLLAAGSRDKTARVIEAATGKEVCKTEFDNSVTTVSFSPDGCYFAAGSDDCTVRVIDCAWMKAAKEMPIPWSSALLLQCGHQFQADGRLAPLTSTELLDAQQSLRTYIASIARPDEAWAHAILKWSQMLPEERPTSPWSKEPIRFAASRWFMQASSDTPIIINTAAEAPWHPLEPVSLARLEPKPGNGNYDNNQGTTRTTYLARLTLKRLREADEKLYGRDTLAEYAAWSAGIMHEELKFKPEALEALSFALERTPPEKQQDLLKFKAEIEKN